MIVFLWDLLGCGALLVMCCNTVISTILFCLLMQMSVWGQTEDLYGKEMCGLGAEAGTLGWGLQMGARLAPKWGVRLRGAILDYDKDKCWQGVPAHLSMEGSNVGVLLDYYPDGSDGTFYFSAGILLSPARISTGAEYRQEAYGAGEITIGGDVYSLRPNQDEGSLCARAEWNHVQPYLGVGWRGVLTKYMPQLRCGLDVGLTYMGRARTRVQQSGNFIYRDCYGQFHDADTARLTSSIRRECSDFFEVAEKLHVYPVVQFSLLLSF